MASSFGVVGNAKAPHILWLPTISKLLYPPFKRLNLPRHRALLADRNVDTNADRPKTRFKRCAKVGTPSPWRRAARPASCPHPRDKPFGIAVLVPPALPEFARHYSADGRPVRTPRETVAGRPRKVHSRLRHQGREASQKVKRARVGPGQGGAAILVRHAYSMTSASEHSTTTCSSNTSCTCKHRCPSSGI